MTRKSKDGDKCEAILIAFWRDREEEPKLPLVPATSSWKTDLTKYTIVDWNLDKQHYWNKQLYMVEAGFIYSLSDYSQSLLRVRLFDC